MDARLCDQLAGLPVELQLEVAEYLNGNSDSGAFDNDEPRSRHASAYLLGLMCTSRQLRRVARPAYWSEVHIASKSRVSRA